MSFLCGVGDGLPRARCARGNGMFLQGVRCVRVVGDADPYGCIARHGACWAGQCGHRPVRLFQSLYFAFAAVARAAMSPTPLRTALGR